jgi:Trk-type K+ transport system membrane component
MRQTLIELSLGAIAFFLVDRLVRFFGSMTSKKFDEEHQRIRVELVILGVLIGFILFHLFRKGIKLPKWA